MDTRLKNVSKSSLTKFIAPILAVILITVAVILLVYIDFRGINLESIIVKEYKDSKVFAQEVNSAIGDTYELLKGEKNNLKNVEYIYQIKDNHKFFTNISNYSKDFYAQNKDGFFSYEKGIYTFGETTNPLLISSFPGDKDYTMYIAFPDEFMQKEQRLWDNGREVLIPIILSIMSCLVLSGLLIIYLIFVTGRKSESDELYTSLVDNVYTDLLFIGLIVGITWFSY